MKKNWMFLCCLAAMLAFAATLIADEQKANPAVPQPELTDLKQQLATLETKVAALEQKLDTLEKAKNAATPGQTPVIIVPRAGGAITLPQYIAPLSDGFADPNHPPKIWSEGECNGWKYYTIPLSCQTTGR